MRPIHTLPTRRLESASKDFTRPIADCAKAAALLAAACVLMALPAAGQSFSSGSTGADGALDLGALSCNDCTIQLPPSGVFNYTTINIPSGKNLFFIKNLRNTPVIMLATGTVRIAGTISVRGRDGSSGPGGFDGGNAGPGFGPGGGTTSINKNGRWVGPVSLVPIVGGSGGWGGGVGGGGGGAIVIASSSSITVTGLVEAIGGTAVSSGAGHGSGGAIRLVANSISMAGGLLAYGGGGTTTTSNPGVIRVETPAGNFTGQAAPAPILSTTVNPVVVPNSGTPSLVIASIGGFAVPSNPAARSDVVDLMLPSQLSDPISVVVRGHNIPVGTRVNMAVGGSSATVTSATLSGTLDSASATLTVSGLSRTAASTLFVFATFGTPSAAQASNPAGRDHVSRIRVANSLGGAPRFSFLRGDGTEVDRSKLPPSFLKQFNP